MSVYGMKMRISADKGCLLLFVALSGWITTTDAFSLVRQSVVISSPSASASWSLDSRRRSPAFVRSSHSSSSSSASPRSVLFMGWGPEPIWSEAKIISNGSACPSGSCASIVVSVPEETAVSFTDPGQYVQVRPLTNNDEGEEVKPIFLAIASPPKKNEEKNEFEFLVKKTDSNPWMTSLSSGSTVEMSQVLGSGFPIQDGLNNITKYDFPTQNVLLFAAGSGIAPIRSAIESGMLDVAPPGDGGRTCRLYYGVADPSNMPYADKFAAWEQMGVEVVPVLSRPDQDDAGPFRTGYVQTALEEDGVPIPRNTGALMCGMKGMAEAVKDLLERAGVFDGRILTNF